MATKTKSRSKQPNQGFRFRPWMGLVLVALVVLAGVIVMRFSQASGSTGVIYAGMPNTQVCTNNYGQVKSLYVCRGELVNTADGQAWRTSVNEIGPVQWFGPMKSLQFGLPVIKKL